MILANRKLVAVWAVSLVVLAAGRVDAQVLPFTVTGTFNNRGFVGSNPGFTETNMGTAALAGSMFYNNFGSVLSGMGTVSSFSIRQADEGNRVRPKVLEFTNGQTTWTETLTDTRSEQTVTFASPVSVPLGWVAVRVKEVYTGEGTDSNFGLLPFASSPTLPGYGFAGSISEPLTNFNTGLTPTITGGFPNLTFPARITDNVLYSTDGGDQPTQSFFAKDAGVGSILVNYAQPQSVNLFGLGFATNSSTNNSFAERTTPKFVTLVGLDAGDNVIASQQVDVYETLQYGRYFVSGFTNVSKLRLDFPNGSNNGDWYNRADANYGVTEFQAFYAVPEPASLALLACGGGGSCCGFVVKG